MLLVPLVRLKVAAICWPFVPEAVKVNGRETEWPR